MPLVALSVVKLPAAAVVPPIVIPLIVPPVSVTLLLAWVEMLPSSKLVLAAAAVLAPVPPLATGSIPETKLAFAKSTVPALPTPPITLTKPVELLKSCPVPPYCVPTAVPVQVPETTLPKRTFSSVVPLLWVRSNRLLAASYFRRPPLLPICTSAARPLIPKFLMSAI